MINNSPISFKHRVLNHFNSILDSSIPQAYKHSLVLPVLKPQKLKTDIKSYRPISLNSCLAKTLDKIIAKRLWWFVLNNNLIDSNQIGFRRGRSVIYCVYAMPNSRFFLIISLANNLKKFIFIFYLLSYSFTTFP